MGARRGWGAAAAAAAVLALAVAAQARSLAEGLPAKPAKGKQWALLIAGSNGYGNYRHQVPSPPHPPPTGSPLHGQSP